jgi:prepilin-type N-terminal cleavage/methylation domain-containing protein
VTKVAVTERGMRRPRRRRGFTAVELLIVVTIIGLMAVAAMPRISRVVAEQRIRKLQEVVATDLERAFAMARRERKPITIMYNTSTYVLTVADRASGTALFTDYIGRFDDMSTTSVTFSPSAGITIFPMGLSTAALTITLTNATYTRTVSVTRAGQVTRS